MRKGTRGNGGFILADLGVTILIVLLMIPPVMLSLSVLAGSLSFDERVQDLIASEQLKKILLLSYERHSTERGLSFVYQEKERELCYMNGHVVIRPGTQIFYSDIDDAYIYATGGRIRIHVTRRGDSFDETLCQEDQ